MATALAFGRANHTVYATMRDPQRSPELAQIAGKEQLPIRIVTMDVDSDNSVKQTMEEIQSKHGEIDILINNAGIERRGSVEELPLAEVRAVMETNFFGALRCIQSVMPRMRARRSGWIVNVTSVAGRLSSPPMGAYAASKYALEGLSESLAQEAKLFNIHVAIIEPGIIDTAMARRVIEPLSNTVYPHARRMAAMFSASLAQQSTPPDVVAQKILEIVKSGTWKLRHPTGPDAEGYLQMRAATSDEDWVNRGALDDEAWNQAFNRS
jgi:NAD(P)-dependent dehydrogenase (short-subunit alcohol dehydrogenase family)